jgi:DNA-binding MurR/RpiR family transcriptional regulator
VISAEIDRLSDQLAAVGRAVLGDPARAASSSVAELAELARTSPATVVRFCRAVGLDGFQDLRMRLAEERGRVAESQWVADIGTELSPGDPLDRVAAVVASTDVQTIQRTVAQLDLDAVDRVARAVVGAGRTDVYGVGASSAAGFELQARLFRIGQQIRFWSEPNDADTSAALLTGADVAIGISHSGVTREVVEPLQLAAERGALTVAVTNYPRSPLAAVAGITLTTAVVESGYRQGAMAALHSQLVVIDCLYIRIAQLDHERATAALVRTAGIHDRHAAGKRRAQAD